MRNLFIIPLICLLSACEREESQQKITIKAKPEINAELAEHYESAERLRKGAKNKKDCDKVNEQIAEQKKKILLQADEYQIVASTKSERIGWGKDEPRNKCTEGGWR